MKRPYLYPAVALLVIVLAGCETVASGYDRLFGRTPETRKPAELVPIKPVFSPKVIWQGSVGGAEKQTFFPAVAGGTVYAAGAGGQITGFDAANGRQTARIEAGQRLSGGVGAGEGLVLAGTPKGEVLAFGRDGKLQWKAQLSGEVLAPAKVDGSVVVARAGDGRIFGLDAGTGKRRWVYQRSLPALSVRSYAGVVIYRGAVFAGFPGGRMIALSLSTGSVGWEAIVAVPRGTTELERVADITSPPVVDDRQACAVSYQGRVACFDASSGASIWARDLSSIAGMSSDARNLYITDDQNALVALDKTNGASLWKQDKLFGRGVTGPLALGRYVMAGDFEGYVHFLSREDGSFAARIATDGSPIIAPPVALDMTSFVVQTRNGGVFAISAQ
ncbi:MAG TPA: outer membrane protein assembly factor BamB [Burkholderiales bacterium]|nr:outer membrane protein assembly factor BamB [Burkholderiales bacterium]